MAVLIPNAFDNATRFAEVAGAPAEPSAATELNDHTLRAITAWTQRANVPGAAETTFVYRTAHVTNNAQLVADLTLLGYMVTADSPAVGLTTITTTA